jgi:biopolymer transport protein ExbD
MSGSVSGQVKAEPNLTPILDMVFQLITFFVLIFNCKNAEMASGVDLPVIGSARAPGRANENDRVIVFNCKFEDAKPNQPESAKNARQPQIWVAGTVYSEEKLADLVAAEQKRSLEVGGLTLDDIHTGGKELPDVIAVRADVDIPFGIVNKVINACQIGGYRQFAFKTKIQKETSAP